MRAAPHRYHVRRTTSRVWATFVCAALALAGFGVAHADEPVPGIQIPFKHLDDQAIKKFARTYYEKRLQGVDKIQGVMRDLLYAQFDLNDDGVPELLFILQRTGWCGSAGCRADIFRMTPRGYELICGASLDEVAPDGSYGPRLLPETENGYHLIYTHDILRWNAEQEFNSGTLCYTLEQ